MSEETATIQQLTETDFWKPRPRLFGWRTWSLLIPSLASAIGFFAFAVLAFSFTELTTLPENFRKMLVLIGSFALAFGGEVGTLTTVIEIFRKTGSERSVHTWDWVGLIVSVLATLAAFLLAFATLLGEAATWARPVKTWGAIALGFFAALDSYTNFGEMGLFLSQHDQRMKTWEKEYHRWRRWAAQQMGWAEDTQQQSMMTHIMPTGDFAYTPPMPINEVVTSNGLRPRCWCGVEVPEGKSPSHWYGRHKALVHKREVKEFGDAVEAHSVLRDKYADTLNEGMWPFPTVLEIAKWRGGVVEN